MQSMLSLANAKKYGDTRANGATTSRPQITYGASDYYSVKMDRLADAFKEAGLLDEANIVRAKKSKLDNTIPDFLRTVGSETSVKAKQIEKSMVGHSRSGYVPTTNLEHSIEMKIDKTTQVTIAPDTNYDAYVEYGTRKHPVPEPYMENTYKEMGLVLNVQLAKFANTII